MKTWVISCAMLAAGSLASADWPRYLGPGGDAKVAGSLPAKVAPKVAWSADVGIGCSGFAIAGDRAVVVGNQRGNDMIACYDADGGGLLWEYSFPEELRPKYYDGGPSATPTIDEGRVYTLSRTGNLFCLSLKDGSVIWHRHYHTDFGGQAPTWGYAAAPIVRGPELFCLPCSDDGAVVVLDKRSGELRSRFGGEARAGYSAPVFFKAGGRDAMAAFHGRELVGYDLDGGGKVMFRHPWRTSYDVNASNPQFHDGKAFIASGYGKGYAVLDLGQSPPRVLHNDEDTRLIFQNSILHEGDIIAVFGDRGFEAELIRMDMASGAVRWRERIPGSRGSCLMVGDSLVVLAETGDLIVGKPGRDGWRESGRAKVLGGTCWAPLAYADGLVFARNNDGKAVAVKLR